MRGSFVLAAGLATFVLQAPSVPWLTYEGHAGGQPLGPAPRSTPLG
jgi:hypothetical protein